MLRRDERALAAIIFGEDKAAGKGFRHMANALRKIIAHDKRQQPIIDTYDAEIIRLHDELSKGHFEGDRPEYSVFERVCAVLADLQQTRQALADVRTEKLMANAHLDAIITAYALPGLAPLTNAIQVAREWCGVSAAQDASGAAQ